MYYEEKTIDGVLCCRSAPDGAWEKKAEKQPEALRLADWLEETIPEFPEPTRLESEAAAELRRLHAANAELLEALKGMDEAYCRSGYQITKAERHEDRLRLIACRAAIAKHGATS